MDELIILVLCHLIGDYVLQSDFIAKTKGENWYHLFAHSALYCVPFILLYGTGKACACLFLSHVMIDALKARYKVIGYIQDQVFHYIAIYLYFGPGGLC